MKSAEGAASSEYSLSDDDHEWIRQDHIDRYIETTQASEEPKVIILAGQPGSGKSALKAAAISEFPPNARPVVVDVDKLRDSHTLYDELKIQNDRTAAGKVQRDAGKWGDELVQDARYSRRNIVIDGTLKSPDKAQTLCKQFKEAGYRVELRALAVRQEDSELGVYSRFENLKAKEGRGRWVEISVHDAAYLGLPKSIDRLNRSQYVDRIEIYRRSPSGSKEIERIYRAAPGKGDPVAVLLDERSREREPQEHDWYISEVQKVKIQIEKRDPGLREVENREFVEKAKTLEAKSAERDAACRLDPSERSRVDPSSRGTAATKKWAGGQDRELGQNSHDRWSAAQNAKRGLAAAEGINRDEGKPAVTEDRWKAAEKKSPIREAFKE